MKKYKLGEIGILSRGKSKHRPRNDKILYGGKYPFVQTSDIKNADHILRTYSQTYNETGLKQSKLWRKNTICITIAANIAESAILGFDACFPDSVLGLVVDDKIADYHYIEYLLQHYKKTIQNQSNGTSQENINLSTFDEVYFEIPPLKEQQKIGRILSSIDDKIAINNQINAILERVAKAIYEYYFVQFDFPDKQGKPYKSSGGAMRFDSTLNRPIPKDFEVCSLGDLCEMYQPQTLTTKQLVSNGKYFVYGANGIIGKHNEYNHINSEIVIACRGNCSAINRTLPKSWIIGNAMVVKLKNNAIHNEYIYHTLKHINIESSITGSVQKQITRTNLAPIKILSPNIDIVLEYCSIVKSNVELRLKNEIENQKLKNLRDFLLPLLINAQVQI